jgi:hypothetical protein
MSVPPKVNRLDVCGEQRDPLDRSQGRRAFGVASDGRDNVARVLVVMAAIHLTLLSSCR